MNVDDYKHEILRFMPPFPYHREVWADNILKQCYYYNYGCPQFVIMREEYGFMPKNSFMTYIFEAKGYDLMVLSCTEHSPDEIVRFNVNYPYIRLPKDRFTTWAYQISDDLYVNCKSCLVRIDRLDPETDVLKIERRMFYLENQVQTTNLFCEYYLSGTGLVKIEFFEE